MGKIFGIIFAIIITISLILPTNIYASAPQILFDNEYLETDVAPIIVDDRTLVPVRVIVEKMGGTVDWDEINQIVTIYNDTTTIVLTMDSNIAIVNDEEVELDVPAQILDGRTLIPLRFVAENLGLQVDFYENTVILLSDVNASTDESKVIIDDSISADASDETNEPIPISYPVPTSMPNMVVITLPAPTMATAPVTVPTAAPVFTPTPVPTPKPSSTPTPTPVPTPTPTPVPTPLATPVPEEVTEEKLYALAEEVVRLTNIERENVGVAPLKMDMELNDVAMLKAKEMVELDYFSHESPNYGAPWDFAEHYGYNGVAGENIAWGDSTAEGVVDSWMNSPGHKSNMLDPEFTIIGVGVYPKSSYGGSPTYIWVQNFVR